MALDINTNGRLLTSSEMITELKKEINELRAERDELKRRLEECEGKLLSLRKRKTKRKEVTPKNDIDTETFRPVEALVLFRNYCRDYYELKELKNGNKRSVISVGNYEETYPGNETNYKRVRTAIAWIKRNADVVVSAAHEIVTRPYLLTDEERFQLTIVFKDIQKINQYCLSYVSKAKVDPHVLIGRVLQILLQMHQ